MKTKRVLSEMEMGLHEVRMQVQSFEKYIERQKKIDAAERKKNPNKPPRICTVCNAEDCPWSEW